MFFGFHHHFIITQACNRIHLVFENGAPFLNYFRIKILSLLSAFFFFSSSHPLAVLTPKICSSVSSRSWRREVGWEEGFTPLFPIQKKQMHNSWCHMEVFSETSLEHVWASEGPGHLQTVTVCCVKEQSINLQSNVKRTGFSCLCVGRKPNVCCHLMVKSVYTCSYQLST